MNPLNFDSASRTPRSWSGPAVVAALVLAAAPQAGAAEWKWSVTPYAWAANLGADVSLGGRQVVDKEVPVSDLIEDVDTTLQFHFEGQRGEHGLMFDLFDIQLSQDGQVVSLPSAEGASAVLSSDVGMTILEAGGIFDPLGDQRGFAIVYGTRILDQSAEIGARYEITAGNTVDQSYAADETLVDALFGVRYVARLSRRWSTVARIDASAGGTQLTWSAGSSINYAFGDDGRYAVTAGYRRMAIDFDTEDSADVDMTLSGFYAGVRFSF